MPRKDKAPPGNRRRFFYGMPIMPSGQSCAVTDQVLPNVASVCGEPLFDRRGKYTSAGSSRVASQKAGQGFAGFRIVAAWRPAAERDQTVAPGRQPGHPHQQMRTERGRRSAAKWMPDIPAKPADRIFFFD